MIYQAGIVQVITPACACLVTSARSTVDDQPSSSKYLFPIKGEYREWMICAGSEVGILLVSLFQNAERGVQGLVPAGSVSRMSGDRYFATRHDYIREWDRAISSDHGESQRRLFQSARALVVYVQKSRDILRGFGPIIKALKII